MPRAVDNNQRTLNRQKARHRNGKRKRNKASKQVRVSDLVNVEFLDQNTSGFDESAPNTRSGSDSKHPIGNKQSKVKLAVALTENVRYIDPEDLENDNLVFRFVTKGDEEAQEPRRIHQAELINSFCHPAAFRELQSDDPKISSRKVCLIDDRTNDDAVSVSLGNYKPLTVFDMYRKLMEKRFHAASLPTPPVKLDAHRRLIFMTDPDSHGVVALMATAPLSQVNALSEFFYYYIAFKPHIGIFNESHGFPTFAFSFHLPFYSWTSTQQEPRDLRPKQDGRNRRPLRCVHNMSFLQSESQGLPYKIDYLCEAQVSILVTGIDQGIWTGFCFVDTYYQAEDRRQCVEDYCESELQMDPFTDGRCDAGQPLLDPGEYFLTDLEYQLKFVRHEWMNTAHKFKQKVEAYTDKFKFPSTKSGPLTDQESQQLLEWLRQTRRRASQLIATLDRTISCWDNFASKDQFVTSLGRRSLTVIQQTFVEARNCLKELQDIRTLCNDHEKMFNLHTIDMGKRAAHVQAQAAESSQKASFIQLYAVAPVILTAAILSMQEKAIPGFIGPNKLSFIVLMPIMIFLVFGFSKIIHCWEKIRLSVPYLLAPHEVPEEDGIELCEV
ncbi:hypothetical protein FSARC_6523 [Fusarium sarcochroum]|uniref:Uncharacterized protein n=1 Tax=Fusarium sarcochroum TaxID=1208366 RepID=A0A8H4TXI2_9HYPO|nr:hypothetical protein FSARC_6523 [Fusarium sarcochroum]